MPNWCENHYTVTGPIQALGSLLQAFENNRLFQTYIPTETQAEAINKWGTKWDIGPTNGTATLQNEILTLHFQSAWSPPTQFFQSIEPLLNIHIKGCYLEPGIAFYGYYQTDYPEQTIAYPHPSQIPQDIQDTFNYHPEEENTFTE